MSNHSIELPLVSHFENPPDLNKTILVEVILKNSSVQLLYYLENPANNLLIPPQSSPARRDNLWQHTCCEAFIGIIDQPHYLEFNFSPSGEWAAYAFSDYRERTDWQNPDPPDIRTTETESGIKLEATILLDTLPSAFRGQSLELGLSTVLEDKEHNLAYLALAHATEKPDFHRREQWINLQL